MRKRWQPYRGTLAWLARRGMTHEQLEFYVADAARVQALRRRVVGDGVDAHFASYRDGFRRVTTLFPCPDEQRRIDQGWTGGFLHGKRPRKNQNDQNTAAKKTAR